MSFLPSIKSADPLRAKARRVLKAELFDTGGISVKAMAHITREAQNQGPAWLATEAAAKEAQDDEARNAIFSDGSYGNCREVCDRPPIDRPPPPLDREASRDGRSN